VAKNPTERHASELMRELRAENRRLHTRLIKLEAKEISYKNKIAALEKEIKSGNNRELKKILDEISANGSTLPVHKRDSRA
jgi:hypothetical protein